MCWLLVLPCVLAWRWDVQARREFALALPRGELAREERAVWAGLNAIPLWQLLLLLAPAFSLAAFRVWLGVLGSG